MCRPSPDSFRLVSERGLSAAPDAVRSLLVRPEDWPRWRSYVKRVELASPGDADGIAAVHRTRWGSRLPYGLDSVFRTLRAERAAWPEVEGLGDADGLGQRRLAPCRGGTRIRYTWTVRLARPWMRRLAPRLHGLFAWNRHQAMRAGAQGMARRLGATLETDRGWEGADPRDVARQRSAGAAP